MASEPDLAVSPKVVAGMLIVALNATKTNAMEGFFSQFVSICEIARNVSLLMDSERLMLRLKTSFPAAEAAERATASKRQGHNSPNRTNMVGEFDMEIADDIVKCYVVTVVNRAPWRTRAGNSEISEKIRTAMHGKDTRHCSLCSLPGHLHRFCKTPKELVSAIRRIIQWLVPFASATVSLDEKGTPFQSGQQQDAVLSFYATESFGEIDNEIRSQVATASAGKRSFAAFERFEADEFRTPCTPFSEGALERWLIVGEMGFSFSVILGRIT